ncbi:uncharacterized protein LOC111995679 [Quercus suber]|uniref:uncharacterized protein LOC111995679 n=1 Tax=Quercus suber TaxID=58331 RepID=UPI0032DE5D3E
MEQMESLQLDHDGNCFEEASDKQLLPPGSPEERDIFGDPQVNTRVGDDYQVEIPSLMTNLSMLSFEVNKIEDGTWEFVSNHDESGNPNVQVKARNRKKIHLKLKKRCTVNSLNPQMFLDWTMTRNQELQVLETCNGFLLGLYIFGKNFISIKRFIQNKEMGEMLSFYYGEFYRSDRYRRWSDSRKVRNRKCITGRKIFTGWRLQELLSRLLPQVPEEFQSTLVEGSKSFAEGRTSLEEFVCSLKSTVGIHILVEAIGIGKGKEDLTGLAMEPGKTNHIFQVCPNLPTGKACSSLSSSEILKFLTGGFRLSKARCNDIFWEAVWPRLLAKGWHSEQPKDQGYVTLRHYLVFLMPGVKKFSRRKLVKGDHYFDSVSDVLSKVASEPKLLDFEAEEATVRSSTEDGWVPEVTSDPDDPSNYQRHCYLKPRVSICNQNGMKFTVVDTSSVHGGKSSNVRELRYLPVESKRTSKLFNHLNDNEGKFFENSIDGYEVSATDMPLNIEMNINKPNHTEGTIGEKRPNGMKFTVVDTSLLHGKKSSKVRELRYSPFELKSNSELTTFLRETEGTSEDSLDGHALDAANILLSSDKNIISDSDNTNQKAIINNSDTTANKIMESHQDEKTTTSDDRQLKRTIKHQFSRRVKSGHSNFVAPVIKRRKLTSCANAKKNCIVEDLSEDLGSKKTGLSVALNPPDAGKNVSSQVGSQEKVPSIICAAKSSPEEESGGGILSGNFTGMKPSYLKNETHQSLPSFDLNLPRVYKSLKMAKQ